jgi:hypothetical protein
MRKTHIKYGIGTVITDHTGLCNKDEVLFNPDGGIFDRLVQPDSTRALSVTAPYDIVDTKDLIVDSKDLN